MTVDDMKSILKMEKSIDILDVRDNAIDFKTGSDKIRLRVVGQLDREMITETNLRYDSDNCIWTVTVA